MNGHLQDNNPMDTNTIATLAGKPATGITIGLGATVLTWLGIITTVFGCLAAIIGAAAAIYSLIHNRNLVRQDEIKMAAYKKAYKKSLLPKLTDDEE
jgi:tetrahydromethanopterin S-methyltransferase subunit E